VSDVDIAVAEGESVAVMGRSGSGKTTLLSILGLLLPPDSGRVLIGGEDTADLTDRRLSAVRNARLGFVFQNYSLMGHLTAAENVAIPLLQGRTKRGLIARRVASALEAVGLADRAESKPVHLSGGEQQRVAIARAIVGNPSIVLADEPTGALDGETAAAVLETLRRATSAASAALVVVTHDETVASTTDRVVRLEAGVLTAAVLR
jgi:ABC-type lipoprotein export system ATPase subunit